MLSVKSKGQALCLAERPAVCHTADGNPGTFFLSRREKGAGRGHFPKKAWKKSKKLGFSVLDTEKAHLYTLQQHNDRQARSRTSGPLITDRRGGSQCTSIMLNCTWWKTASTAPGAQPMARTPATAPSSPEWSPATMRAEANPVPSPVPPTAMNTAQASMSWPGGSWCPPFWAGTLTAPGS